MNIPMIVPGEAPSVRKMAISDFLSVTTITRLDTMLNAVEHMNFFEGRATEYSKAATKGTWSEAFSEN